MFFSPYDAYKGPTTVVRTHWMCFEGLTYDLSPSEFRTHNQDEACQQNSMCADVERYTEEVANL